MDRRVSCTGGLRVVRMPRPGSVPLWAIVLLVTVIVMIVAGVTVAQLNKSIWDRVADQYAGLQAKDMLIRFMARNDGRWPKGWEDLREAYDVVAGEGENYCAFDDVQERVLIDFDLTPNRVKELAQRHMDDRPAFLLLRSGRDAVWYGVDLNEQIAKYLRVHLEPNARNTETGEPTLGHSG
jgi:hypothetical protein